MGADEEGTLECLKALRRGAWRALRTDARRQLMEQQFDFLGFTLGRMYSPRTGQARLALRPCWRQDPRKIVSDFARLSAGASRIQTSGPSCDWIAPFAIWECRRRRRGPEAGRPSSWLKKIV